MDKSLIVNMNFVFLRYLKLKSSIYLSHFFRLNLVALRINNHYKLNIYLMLFIFICIISSIIFRSNLITGSDLEISSPFGTAIMLLLILFTTVYSLKLMIDIIIRGVQAFKIIPEFIYQYKQASSASQMMNLKSIISLYYIQNIFFMLLSCWILYLLFSKLNMFIDSIYLLIIYFGILGSILFYPLVPFNFSTAKAVKNYPI
jgi:hypothetical protein